MAKPIHAEEERRILSILDPGNDPKAVKRALQDICEHYEKGFYFLFNEDIREKISRHLDSKHVLVRRWTLKALGFVADRDDTQKISERLKKEDDPEAITWGVATLIRRAKDRGLKEVCAEAGLYVDTPILLASRLYAPNDWIEKHASPIEISLNSDDLTLIWSIFLTGYGKAPESLFSPRHPNAVFLGELNKHDNELIAERSIWALWERDDLSYENCTLRIEDASKYNANVRKWLYQLAVQSPDLSGFDGSAALDFLQREEEASARDGLAKAIAFSASGSFDDTVVEWFPREKDPGIRQTLLNGLAKRVNSDSDAAELIRSVFEREQPGSRVRQSILAAAQRGQIYTDLRALEAREKEYIQPSLALESPTTIVNIYQEFKVTNFNAGNNIIGQNLVGGDMVNSANQAVQNLSDSHASDRAVLSEVIEFLKHSTLPQKARDDVYEAVKSAAETPSQETRKGLLEKLSDIGSAAASVGKAIEGLDRLIEHVQNWSQ